MEQTASAKLLVAEANTPASPTSREGGERTVFVHASWKALCFCIHESIALASGCSSASHSSCSSDSTSLGIGGALSCSAVLLAPISTCANSFGPDVARSVASVSGAGLAGRRAGHGAWVAVHDAVFLFARGSWRGQNSHGGSHHRPAPPRARAREHQAHRSQIL